MEQRVILKWTSTAKNHLAKLPRKVRRGILDKANLLREGGDPRAAHKALIGPLQGYYRITYGRHRAIYRVDEETLPDGNKLVSIIVLFVAVGQRKEHDPRDIYKVAKRLIQFGLAGEDLADGDIELHEAPPSEDSSD